MGRRVTWCLLGIILGVALLLRLKGITNPLLDDQGWRQADTASIAVHMLGHLFDFPRVMIPQLNYDGVVPQRVELEFPLFPYLLAWTWTLFGWADIWGRLWAVILTLFGLCGLYDLGRNLISERAGLLAAAIYALMPLSIYYGRVVMPEPMAQALSIWALALIVRWRRAPERHHIWKIGLVLAGAILAKLPQLMLFPVALLLGFYPLRQTQMKKILSYCFFALCFPMVYYAWVHMNAGTSSQFVSGILKDQVVNSGSLNWKLLIKNVQRGLTDSVLFLSGLGLLRLFFKRDNGRLALLTWVGIGLLYLGIVCVRIPLDYYLIPVLPLAALLSAYALDECKTWYYLVIVLMLLIVVNRESYTYLKPKYQWNPEYLTQAEWIKEHTPSSSVLVLSDPAPMTFYYAHRVGFRLPFVVEGSGEEFPAQVLSQFPGDYVVRLPKTQQHELFWKNVRELYPEVGPGVYSLKKQKELSRG
ncbi:PMT family glycosyltransferase, 4-amino-4-deoxy-L-arabinose transferase [Desulfosporosinus acidiphilus SJ4]|uniref:PMT family glycosyltransferase, 4-amino-4-deoxy-L-arabinose transferase n=1 Tax=Desulfosporosinus acidiphilus (strain DSM 22704 / JCM 16185 / SJ4) TaxID=646529 RepID=I4D4Q3_DESAJ|nr:glycosyltransferase family 39 protein [Desulfosporosinus acidiphilus]AFM40777.1 PMT family glycosyltransferase, 4-amino-4-deoxy-L-arabinose transferase [Desulfosporosinus acidiphilus SJ4]